MDRLQVIRHEYSEIRIKESKINDIKANIDKLDQDDRQQTKLKQIHELLNLESSELQKHLSSIKEARNFSNHPSYPLNVKIKFLSVDTSGILMEQPLCLVNGQGTPISDELKIIRLPYQSDRFQILNDKYELIIVDENQMPLSEPITFKQLTSESIQFEYVDPNRQAIRIVGKTSYRLIDECHMLSVKPVSFDKLSTTKQPAGNLSKINFQISQFFKQIKIHSNVVHKN